ncbi:MAG: GTP cyclohydrolase, FolE2/MptA family [Candidatus Thermoplasmatota archaeon]|nr:GTP cyclohydrolase, FolE2/MptA family [Candidatus Thermoplasmatota archaeon]
MPSVRIPVDRVCILDLRIPITLSEGEFFATSISLDVLTHVDRDHRGASLSGIARNTLEMGFRDASLDSLFSTSGTVLAGLAEKGIIVSRVRARTDIREKSTGRSVRVLSEAWENGLSYGIEITGINACPCAQESIGLKTGIVPGDSEAARLITHNQRIVSRVILKSGSLPTFSRLLHDISGVTHGPLSSTINSDEEADLLISIHGRPMFVEDIVREIALAVSGNDELDDSSEIEVTCRSLESIHPHDLEAGIVTSLGKIRQSVRLN